MASVPANGKHAVSCWHQSNVLDLDLMFQYEKKKRSLMMAKTLAGLVRKYTRLPLLHEAFS